MAILVPLSLVIGVRAVSARMPPSGFSGFPSLTIAQDFSPPDDWSGTGQRQGGGSRGGMVIQGEPLVALTPSSTLGTTLSATPTFFFYIPLELAGLDTEFFLLDEQETVVYEAIAPLPSQQGIISMALPVSVNLEAGQRYQWVFSVVVSPDDRANDMTVYGWVQRQPTEPTLAQRIEATPSAEQPALYRQLGLWYEALGSLAALRRANPGDVTLQAQWVALLESVDLGAIANQPLLAPLSATSETASSNNRAASRRPVLTTTPSPTRLIADILSQHAEELSSDSPGTTITTPPPQTVDLRPEEIASQDSDEAQQQAFYNPPESQGGAIVSPARPDSDSSASGESDRLYAPPRLPLSAVEGASSVRQLIRLIPLIPRDYLGSTLSPNPTFLVYLADEREDDFVTLSGLEGELILLTEDESEELYRGTVNLPAQPGITSVALPASVTLEPGQTYRWVFEAIVDPDDRSRSGVVDGLIQRRMLTPEQQQQLETVSLEERSVFYGEWSFWYDALSLLADSRRTNPEDTTLQRWWNALLESAELEDLIGQPLLDPLSVQSSTNDASFERILPSLGSTPPDPIESPSSTRDVIPSFYIPPDVERSPGGREGGGTR